MDDETRIYLDAMESRMMARMNDNQEKLLERMRLNEMAIQGINNTLMSMTTLLTSIAFNQGDLARRVTDIEKR